ncbi:toll-like receptor 4 [Physella acuta]|uniref:toll-like receptor 4 n=1 Tax=Physella acuta TaxID=109671 RepID=UPI0027DC0E06|nr:toll-like receptor 4 [Physella acuta]
MPPLLTMKKAALCLIILTWNVHSEDINEPTWNVHSEDINEPTWNVHSEDINEPCPDQCTCVNGDEEMSCNCFPNWPHVPFNTKRLTLNGERNATIICGAFDNLNHLEDLILVRFRGIDACEKYFWDQRFSLRYLTLDQNFIVELPVNLFANLQNLTYLRLSDNQLTYMQDGVFAGSSDFNPISSPLCYPDIAFSVLTGLQNLRFSGTDLSVNLNGCPITSISGTSVIMESKVAALDLSFTHLNLKQILKAKSLEKKLPLSPKLERLYLRKNNINLTALLHAMANEVNTVKHLDLSQQLLTDKDIGLERSCNFSSFPERKYNESGLFHLEFLDLSNNENLPDSLLRMQNLQTLNISHIRNSTYLKVKFNLLMSQVPSLEELQMSNLKLNSVDSNLTFPRKLKKINLSYNKIRSFHSSVLRLLNLTYLDLSYNELTGFTKEMADELQRLKSHNSAFLVDLQGNVFAFECVNLPILNLLAESPGIFYKKENIFFATETSLKFNYTQMIEKLQGFSKMCQIKENFSYVLSVFFTHLLCLLVLSVFFHYRWKLRYLYFIGQRRLHIGGRLVNYNPQVDVFITYDEGEPRVRRLLKDVILPFLREKNVSYILGEVDFPGGDMVSHISGAITGTRKTLVLLSEDLFLDHYREYEMNLAIMREFNVRGQVIVPVFVERVDLNTYPPEVETYLRNQLYRCLVYRNNQIFWTLLLHAIMNDK